MSFLQSVMVSVADFEEYARKHLPKMAFDYYASGADEQQTLTDNIWAFKRFLGQLLLVRLSIRF